MNINLFLLEIAHKFIINKQSIVLVFANENETLQAVQLLKSFFDNSNIVIYIPGFLQAGVFKYESAKKVIAHRLNALKNIDKNIAQIIVCSLAGWLRVIPSLNWIKQTEIKLIEKQEYEINIILQYLNDYGYIKTDKVEDIGEYSLKGSILDFWTPGQKDPYRLDIFGDILENIRFFKIGDQKSFAKLSELYILPCREFIWETKNKIILIKDKLNDYLVRHGASGEIRTDMMDYFDNQMCFPGIDDLATLCFNSEFDTLEKHLIKENILIKNNIFYLNTIKIFHDEISQIVKIYENHIENSKIKKQWALRVEFIFPKIQNIDEIKQNLFNIEKQNLFNIEKHNFNLDKDIELVLNNDKLIKTSMKLEVLKKLLNENKMQNICFLTKNSEEFFQIYPLFCKYLNIEAIDILNNFSINNFKIEELFKLNQEQTCLSKNIYILISQINDYFYIQNTNILYVSLDWLQSVKKHELIDNLSELESQKLSKEATIQLLSHEFADFSEGDLVVHVQYGIGKFKGLVKVKVMDIVSDFLIIEYANNDKIYLPVNKMNQIQRYIGSLTNIDKNLDSLKSSHWEKKKEKVRKNTEKVAKEIMEYQAKRATQISYAYSPIDEDYLEFEQDFPYNETEDQIKANNDIMSDLSRSKPMDRLLIGDVGFGKTEVAMRAAFRAVLDKKQVAWLVPTTVLAHQHHRTLIERMNKFGIELIVLDRTLTKTISQKEIKRISEGKIDIIIGTHRLLSKDIKFKDLGLIIVDEEQRFGVLQKEKIKTISQGIDVLSMSATPIPRTLQMALMGLRELSLLTTPPKARLAVKTFVCPFDEIIISTAINTELSRGGQIFYVHNRINELSSIKEFLEKMIPNAKIVIGHAQMTQGELEELMINFIDQKFDILLCTTIIESGIDMPNVNTIIIQNANQFGLAQLYQLRGRVGRRSTKGYAYFIHSDNLKKDDSGMERLNIIKEHQALGSGFIIASKDMEMRGAGDILGDEQSGFAQEIGLDTYNTLLEEAIAKLGNKKLKINIETEINIPISSQIPETYIENSKERLRMYRRFFGTKSEEQLNNLTTECEDRFGALPNELKMLIEIAKIRRLLIYIGAISLNVGDNNTELKISPEILSNNNDTDSENIVKQILNVCNRSQFNMRITPNGKIIIPIKTKDFKINPEKSLQNLKQMIAMLAGEIKIH